MSADRSQFNPAAPRVAAPDLRLSAGTEEGIQSPPVPPENVILAEIVAC
jgi:hypothetical protein